MEPFPFNDTLSVGNAHIDGQHRDLIERFGLLGASLPSEFWPDPMLQAMMSDLIIAVTRHFIDEEELMMRNDYPDYEEHAREHILFVEQLSQMLHMDEAEMLRTSIPSLAGRMIQHLKTQDLAYRPYLAADG